MKKLDEKNLSKFPFPKKIQKPARTEKVIKADVIFGSPRCKCAGTGICKIIGPEDTIGLDNYCPCQVVKAKISWVAEWIILEFLREEISSACYQKHFCGGFFMVQDAYEYQSINGSEKYKIRVEPGCYEIIEDQKYIQLFLERIPQNSSRSKANQILNLRE